MTRFALPMLLLVLPLVAGCLAQSEESGEVIYQPVEAVRVSAQEGYQLTRGFTGVVQPAQSADIAFEFAGTIETLHVNEGDQVDAGQLVGKLDTALLDIESRQLGAQLKEAQANLRLIQANLDRQASLETDGYASRARRDELEADRDAINARIAQLQASIDGNRVRIEKAHLYAPFAGVVGERFLENGSAASPGLPVFRILETGRLEAHVGIPSTLARSLAVGDTATVRVAGVDTQGTVLAVGAELKTGSHTVKARIALDTPDAIPGSLVQLQLPDSIGGRGFTVPQSALSASMRGLWRVYVLSHQGEDIYQVEARDLQLRYTGEQEAYVEGGLKDGDLLVASGVHRIVPRQLVRISQGS